MTQHMGITQEVAVLMVPSAVDFADLDYSPALLLDSRFDASLTNDREFRQACETGFGAYFEDMCEWDEVGDEVVLVERCYTWADVLDLVVEIALPCAVPDVPTPSIAWCAGFGLGWLSAHALVHRQDAMRGLAVLTTLLTSVRDAARQKGVA